MAQAQRLADPKYRHIIEEYSKQISYSDKYCDDKFEYRHVILPNEIKAIIPKTLMSEAEWRSYGVQQSRGWVHYAVHRPEPHILLFRRLLTDPNAVASNQVTQ
eukprot:TRINITY_DN1261_c0_g2_i1.p3 TRINITY_DN1261_c0_g2~~TRINITY_DN1261_c0_g2_i1.p3  ORF type:complete len:103 (+),score=19.93 TRINITY_DN1261_c0_g2_i1:79-387(+)